jgi:hypothetical protein
MRTFAASDGSKWTAWDVQSATPPPIPGMPTAWLAFQNEDATERRRLFDFPEHWDELPDERLELLRRMAVPARVWSRLSPPGGVERIEDISGADTE